MGTIIRPSPEVIAMPLYQELRVQAIALRDGLLHQPERGATITAMVRGFQTNAGVVGAGDQPSGLYGEMTQQALNFFLPEPNAPPVWRGTRPGSWTEPAWTRDVPRDVPGPERVITRDVPGPVREVTRTPVWVWGLLGTVGLVVVGVVVMAAASGSGKGKRRRTRGRRRSRRAAYKRRSRRSR